MTTETAVPLHYAIVDACTVAAWTTALLLICYKFSRRRSTPTNTSRVLQIIAVCFIMSHLISNSLWTTTNIAMLLNRWRLVKISAIAYGIIKYPSTNLSFYMFILFRLKIIFKGSVYEVGYPILVVITIIAVISLGLNTWWRILYAEGGAYAMIPDDQETFVAICTYQHYVVDTVIQLTVIYLFTKRLFRIIITIRTGQSVAARPNLESESSSERNFNQQQLGMVQAVAKHALLIGIMVSANLVWMIWFTAFPADMAINNNWLILSSSYMYLVLDVVQIVALYLGFDFARELYSTCCAKPQRCCERCCGWIAVKQMEKNIAESIDDVTTPASSTLEPLELHPVHSKSDECETVL